MKIIIGTRGSPLALRQAGWVKTRLAAAGNTTEIRVIQTSGEKLTDVALTQSGTKGLFIKEIEEALIEGSIHLAVHSLKDLPTDQPAGLTVAAVPEREDARDVLVSKAGGEFASLPPASRLGTGSLRRMAQLRVLRRDLRYVPLRGNVDTRLKKLDRGECEALVLAAAGLRRLDLAERIVSYFPVDQLCPAVGQGALAMEVREGDIETRHAVEPIDHAPTHLAVRAERALLRHLGGGCQVPIAAHAVIEGRELRLVGVVANLEGTELARAEALGPASDPERLGNAVADELLRQGARSILASVQAGGQSSLSPPRLASKP